MARLPSSHTPRPYRPHPDRQLGRLEKRQSGKHACMQFILMTPESFRLGGFALRFRRSRSTNRCLGSEWPCTVPRRSNESPCRALAKWPSLRRRGVALFARGPPKSFAFLMGRSWQKKIRLGPVTISTPMCSTPQSCLKWNTDGGAAQHVQPNGWW